MEPVSPISAALLQLESQTARMHVGWLARVDAGAGGAPLDVEALRERVAGRLERAPRFRRVVAPAGERSGELVWREDPAFAVDRHVAVCDAPVAGEEELRAVVDRFLAEPLGREQPLWRVLVVPRTRGGGGGGVGASAGAAGATIVGKAHRALLDGGDPAQLRDLVFDRGPAGAGGAAAERAGGAGIDGGEDPALGEFRAAHRIGALAAARRSGRLGATMGRAAWARTEGLLAPAPDSYLNASSHVGGGGAAGRTLVTARLELGRLRRIAGSAGTELHEVVLAVAAGALRRVALAAGQEPADLRALVPVDPGGPELLGDAPCAVVPLPVAERTPSARLRALHATMQAARGPRSAAGAGGEVAAGGDATGDGAARPTTLAGPREELPARLAIGARLCNLTLASAHGPERPLHVAGAHVRALFPVMPMPDDHALALSTLTYGRHLHVAAVADPGAIGGVGRLPVMLADAVEELGLSTGARAVRGLP
jgi:WS/DGAT/MGAT family acyltransferase